ncbi:MAG: hypothetical protein R3B37_00335 [Nitrospira sp.]|nr:hypothetical protein [Nitrospira sp.]
MKGLRPLLICWTIPLVLLGCSGRGEVFPLQIHMVSTESASRAKSPEPLRVAISPFEDSRSHKTGLGIRTHLWGGVSYFDVPGGNTADVVATAMGDYLTAMGWQVTKHGAGDTGVDVRLTGKITDFSVHAKSRVGSTKVTTKTRLSIEASNVSDGSVVRMTLDGAGTEDIFWFNPEDAQEVLNEVLTDSFRKLVQGTTVDNRMLRLKTP